MTPRARRVACRSPKKSMSVASFSSTYTCVLIKMINQVDNLDLKEWKPGGTDTKHQDYTKRECGVGPVMPTRRPRVFACLHVCLLACLLNQRTCRIPTKHSHVPPVHAAVHVNSKIYDVARFYRRPRGPCCRPRGQVRLCGFRLTPDGQRVGSRSSQLHKVAGWRDPECQEHCESRG